MKDEVWMEITRDELGLPLIFANSCGRLAELTGVSRNAIQSNICKSKAGKIKYPKYCRVILPKEDEDD